MRPSASPSPGPSRAGIAVGSPPIPLASSAASRVSSNMSRSLFDAAPSVPMPTSTPSASIFATGATPAPELQVARRIVGDAGREVLQRSNLSFVDVHAMRRHDLGPEQPLLSDPRHDGHAVDAARVLDFEQRFGEVRQQRHVELGGQVGAGPQDLRRAGVRRVRRRGGHDQRMRVPARDEAAGAGERVLVAGRVGRRKSQNRLTAERPQAGVGRRFGDGLLEVVHVGEARHARADHLRAAELPCQAARTRASRTRVRRA